MSRATKFVVLASNLAALWLTVTLVSRGIPSILIPAVAAFTAACISTLLLGSLVMSALLSTIYVIPGVSILWWDSFVYSYYAIWLAAACGAMLPLAIGSEWKFPPRFRLPLVLWSLIVALSWPIVVFRELDFVPALLGQGIAGSRLPQLPAVIVVWVSNVASIVMTGLLLLDWMFAAYGSADAREVERRVVWPVMAGAICAALVAVYQSLVDISFMNHSLFQSLGRAVGTMRDANAFGVAMALWLPFAAAKVLTSRERLPEAVGWSIVLAILAIAIWGSGSRTAFLAAAVGLAAVAIGARRALSGRALAAALVVAIIGWAAIVRYVPSTTWTRARAMVPSLTVDGARSVADQLWSRGMYGTAAVRMIEEHPLVGVGVGGFNYQYGHLLFRMGVERKPDNAQNWFRQQLAELGLLGSVGWLVWLGTFLWMLVRCHRSQNAVSMTHAAQGGIFGLAAASLLGMPTQDAAAAITFVVIVGWLLLLKKDCAFMSAPLSRRASVEWAITLGVLIGFLGGTLYAARGDLRPPTRALQIGFPYSYGFSQDPGDPTVRWTRTKAVEVLIADKRWMKVEIGEVAPDAEVKPVSVKIAINSTTILRVNRRSSFPIVRWVRMPQYGTPLMIQIDVGRTWKPSGSDVERGVAVHQWAFVDEDPPRGSVTVESLDPAR